jgi:hypothetical protein
MLGRRIVFRKGRGGRTIVSARPIFSENREFSSSQRQHQLAFKEAIAYARANKHQPLYIDRAQATESTSFNVAVSDWFHPPQVLAIDPNGYTGKAGEAIRIKAVDNVMVTRVSVVIFGLDGVELQKGEARQSETDPTRWLFIAPAEISAPVTAIGATAEDFPGHRHSLTLSL